MSNYGSYDDDDDKKAADPRKKKFFEFDCPNCNANNPWPDGFVAKEEINCHYCGTSFEARIADDGKLKLKEL
jgi:transcription elongation factor Elf1